jgi:O-antigen/teichoic acid export membrane protein
MSVARKILSNTAIQTVGKLITAVLSVLVIKYITSLETIPAYKGVSADYKLIYTYLAFFGIIADFGLFTIAVREFAKGEKKTDFILGNIFSMRVVSIVSAMVLAVVVVFFIHDPNYTSPVKMGVAIAAITTAFTMLASTITSVLQEKLKMAFPTVALLLGKVIMTAYIIWVVMNYSQMQDAFYQLLYAGIIGNGFVFIITYIYTWKLVPFKPQINLGYWKDIFYQSLPYGIAIILSTMYFKIDQLMLSFMRDKSEIAIYGYPASVIELIAIIPIYFMNSVLPVLTKAIHHTKEKIETIIRYSFYFLFLGAVPIVIGGYILAGPFIELIMNREFLSDPSRGFFGSDIAFQLILVSLLFSFVSHLFGYILVAFEKQKKLLVINLVVVIFNIVFNLLAIPYYGFRGAAVTTIFSELLVLILTFLYAKKLTKFTIGLWVPFKILVAGFIMGVVIYPLKAGNVFLVTLLGGFVFMGAIFVLRVVDFKLLRELRGEKTSSPTPL